jgi:RNA polymerase-binding transcription factor DksA
MNSEIDLREFGELLRKRRDELVERERVSHGQLGGLDLDTYGYDLGDRAVHDDDKDRAARQEEANLAELRAVDAAMTRVDEGTYGECVACGANIPPGRLRAIPHTPLCANCAAMREEENRIAPPSRL